MKVVPTVADEYINRLAAARFVPAVVPTGGGCDAIELAVKGRRVLITDDAQVPDTLTYCCVGLYDANGCFVDDIDTDINGVVDAVRKLTADLIPPPSDDIFALCNGDAVTVCCGAAVTFHDTTLCCKACWAEVGR